MQKNSTMRRTGSIIGCFALAPMLSACMSPAKIEHGRGDNWQVVAFVRPVADSPVNLPLVFDCRKDPVGQQSSGTAFAVVRQRNFVTKFVHTTSYWIVRADVSDPLHEGDVVYVNMHDCDVPLVPANGVVELIEASSLSGLSHKTSDIGNFSRQRWLNMAL